MESNVGILNFDNQFLLSYYTMSGRELFIVPAEKAQVRSRPGLAGRMEHLLPGQIYWRFGGKKKSQNKNFDDHNTTI